MAVITFYPSCDKETGNTIAAVAFATFLGITKNKKTLLISTGLNDTTVKESLWASEQKKRSGLFGPNTTSMAQNGIEELDRIIRSNRFTPEIITNYTRVALRERLEALMGYIGKQEQYEEIQKNYPQIVSLAAKAYDTVIVDIDRNMDKATQLEILKASDVVVATVPQRMVDIENLISTIEKGEILNKNRTLIAMGKYDERSKYNAKNVTRSLLRQKEIINTIPYNFLIMEASQEGKLIDIFISLLGLKNKDDNYTIIEEFNRLDKSINDKITENQMMRRK